MKTILFSICMLVSVSVFGQSEKYLNTMGNLISKLDTASSWTTYQQLSAQFERIAAAEKGQWLPAYYQGYCLLMQIWSGAPKEQAPDLLTASEQAANEAASRVGKSVHSEINALQAYVLLGRLSTDPMNGASLTPQILQLCGQATAADPTNPRPHLVQGVLMFHMPEMYGGGKAAAKASLEKAVQLYEQAPASDPLAPKWDAGFARGMYQASAQ